MNPPATPPPPAAPPWERLRDQLLACAEDWTATGNATGGAALRATVEAWWEEQSRWNSEAARLLAVHHEINNALVGVSGNAQLLLMGAAGQQPGVRERLEVVVRESERIRDAALRLRPLRAVLDPDAGPRRSPVPQTSPGRSPS